MTRIDFYILPEGSASAPLVAAARLCDKAALAGKQVYVACGDAAQLAVLDDLLWTQRQGSFIAHERFDGRALSAPLPQVLLGTAEPPADWQDVLINLSPSLPAFFSRFDRLCEIVASDEASRAECRVRYKFYRDRGYDLKTLEQAADGAWAAKA